MRARISTAGPPMTRKKGGWTARKFREVSLMDFWVWSVGFCCHSRYPVTPHMEFLLPPPPIEARSREQSNDKGEGEWGERESAYWRKITWTRLLWRKSDVAWGHSHVVTVKRDDWNFAIRVFMKIGGMWPWVSRPQFYVVKQLSPAESWRCPSY